MSGLKPLVREGDALELLTSFEHEKIDLLATDPPYTFGAGNTEHAISATVAVVLREAAKRIRRGGWAVIMCAASWRSQAYMVESVRGILEPVRVATWVKPSRATKVRTPGWAWSSVSVIAFRRGKSAKLEPSVIPDYIACDPFVGGRRAQLPQEVAEWMVAPFVVEGGLALDPFAGSGAIVAACERAGMHSIGFEVNP
jgi:DNA modification methylase